MLAPVNIKKFVPSIKPSTSVPLGFMPPTQKNYHPRSPRSESQLPQNLISHIFILPGPTRQPLELYTVKRKKGNFDNEDLKLKDHAPAKFALYMCARLSDRARRRAVRISAYALI